MSAPEEAIPYSSGDLFSYGAQRTFSGPALREIAFPLGGIGTGCISLGGRGEPRDWEIFNRPNMGFRPQFTFPALRTETRDGTVACKVLESRLLPPFSASFGTGCNCGEGFPHMESNTFRGEYPFAWLEFEDADVPLRVSLEAFNPFIPLNADDSSLPVAILVYRLSNPTAEPVRAVLCWTLENLVGYEGAGHVDWTNVGNNRNRFRSQDGLSGIFMDSTRHPADSPRYGSLALAALWNDVTYTGNIGGDAGFATGHTFWDAFAGKGGFDDTEMADPSPEGRTGICALGMQMELAPGGSAEVPVLIAWHFPNFLKYWHKGDPEDKPRWRNHYATLHDDAWEVAAYTARNLVRLRAESMTYHDALFGSTLPACVLDAASSQTSTLKSPTTVRLEDGTFYGFEGCGQTWGCCEGSCTHVWNYQQALPFLFPALERSMRAADYEHNLREEDGKMCFRIALPLGTSEWDFHAAADGQLGGMMKTYRDWLISGDDEWLRRLWPRVKKALAYGWEQWDVDRDGLCEGVQHNTYDIELVGPNPLIAAFYMGALRAAEEMARHLGEAEQADEYRALFEQGSALTDEQLFNGEYYVQKYDPEQAKTEQFGDGCLSDQMLGQWLAAVCGLGYLFRPDNVRSALRSVFHQNWRPSLADHANPQRVYALGEEAGLLMCSWPRGNRPLIPTHYCDEVWTGIEYQVASHLIMEGMVEEGLAIVKGARDRHDGVRRNPWDEFECGSHYARAMSSWGLILALSGYFCDASRELLQFDPRVRREDLRTFWSTGSAWGTFAQKMGEGRSEVRLEVLAGSLDLQVLRMRLADLLGEPSASAERGDEPFPCSVQRDGDWLEVRFDGGLTVRGGTELTLALAG
jgi:uncharacterized protein (DUF608 family)